MKSGLWTINNFKYIKVITVIEKTHDQAYRKYIMQKTHLETAFSAKQQQAQKAVKTTKISLSEARITGAKPYFAKKQKKLQQTGQSLLTRLDKLKQIEKRQSLPIIKMNLLSSKLWQGQILVRAHKIRRQTCHHRTKRLRENNFTQTIFKSTQQTLAKCANSRRSKNRLLQSGY